MPQTTQLMEDHIEAQSLDELHDVVVQAVLLADAEDRHDVRMVQLGRRARLTLETAQVPQIEQGVGRQHLDGHVPAQRKLLRLVDDAHAAAAHLTQNLIIAQVPQRRRGGRSLRRTRLARRLVAGLGLFHEEQGRQHVANLVRMLGVAAGEFLDGRTLALPEGLHELVRDLPKWVCFRRIIVAHPQIPSMPPGMP
jgi:hypothetical protein